MVELIVKSPITLEEGKHIGVIVGVEYRTTPYNYTDVVIETKSGDSNIQLKVSFPTLLAPASKLYNFLEKFGAKMEIGQAIDPEKILIGKMCSFLSTTEDTKKGKFAKILVDSVKPAQ